LSGASLDATAPEPDIITNDFHEQI